MVDIEDVVTFIHQKGVLDFLTEDRAVGHGLMLGSAVPRAASLGKIRRKDSGYLDSPDGVFLNLSPSAAQGDG